MSTNTAKSNESTPFLAALDIEGFRGFATNQKLELAIPDGQSGSGLTILVGPNNSGKSTVIESFRAFTARKPPSFTSGRRNRVTDAVRVSLTTTNGQARILRSVNAGSSECVFEASKDYTQLGIYVLPSRRYFNPHFGKAEGDRHGYTQMHDFPSQRGLAISEFSGRLFEAQRRKKEFQEVLSKVYENPPDWTIDRSDEGSHFIKFVFGNHRHSSDGLGEGLVSLLFIIDAFYDARGNDVVVIDEPELSLHPSLQRKLLNLLKECAKHRQIIISTHSPYFLDFEAIANGTKVARVFKKTDATQIRQLSSEIVSKLKGFFTDLNNPHVLGLNAREAFFLNDGIILVEGQEDVVLYGEIEKTVAVSLKGEFYGWGVGGAGKMGIIAQMLHDLGFERVVGILDGDKSEEQAALTASFPDYKFFTIPADDVRTKVPQPARQAVEGLCDTSRRLKPQFQKPMKSLFQEVNSFLLAHQEK